MKSRENVDNRNRHRNDPDVRSYQMLIVTTMFTEIDAKMEIFTREEESIFKIILKF